MLWKNSWDALFFPLRFLIQREIWLQPGRNNFQKSLCCKLTWHPFKEPCMHFCGSLQNQRKNSYILSGCKVEQLGCIDSTSSKQIPCLCFVLKMNVCSYLQLVCLAENFRLPSDDASSLYRLTGGDVRRCLLQLQFWVNGSREWKAEDGPISSHCRFIFFNRSTVV